ncbi:hypothetical protein GYA27_03990 [candidate division WWE3 bacterium]|uniref:Uncharacterized protein n=1 Tax=candidate division WWE3 bacterium TaxID=2053526 RepID=A0A7X9DLI0_UNCKA|nr:hypothetical protein [candidate division WWE3 bacterium]
MNKKLFFVTIAFFVYTIWWLTLQFGVQDESLLRDYFADSYGVLAGIGGIYGLIISAKYSGFKSKVGKSIIFFSAGLLSQCFGQLYYSAIYYVYGLENAYPSYGEVFYLATIPFYIYAIILMAQASGATFSLKNMGNKLWAVAFPIFMLCTSYFFFLKEYDFEGVPFINAFLDFFYPLGQALFVSLALLTLFLVKDLLGGVMKTKVVLILISLVFQYAADSTFIYENSNEIWMPGGLSDLLFVISYFVMTIALIKFETVFEDIKKTNLTS